MSELLRAARIMAALGESPDRLERAYAVIRDALIGAVAFTHPAHSTITDPKLLAANEFFSAFTSIFSTNYDLLLYWAVMKEPSKFVDFFWSKECNFAFDITNVSVSGQRTMIFYVHGALMLSEDSEGRVAKLVNNEARPVLLPAVLGQIKDGQLPVFVSEGGWEQKRRAISGHAYLEFCLSRLGASNQPIVVYGHGLGQSDTHIVRALARSRRSLLAVGLWPTSRSKIESERARIDAELGNNTPDGAPRTVRYFDGRSLNAWEGSPSPQP